MKKASCGQKSKKFIVPPLQPGLGHGLQYLVRLSNDGEAALPHKEEPLVAGPRRHDDVLSQRRLADSVAIVSRTGRGTDQARPQQPPRKAIAGIGCRRLEQRAIHGRISPTAPSMTYWPKRAHSRA